MSPLKPALFRADTLLSGFMPVMDVIVPCDCGSRFSFSIEPVGGRLPEGAELLCPSCGKDGVPLANRVIGDKLRKLERELALTARAPESESKRAAWGKRLKSFKASEPTPQHDPDVISNIAQPGRDPFAKAREKIDHVYGGPNKLKGILGAVAGGLIGAALWTAVVYFTGYEIRYIAVGVGALAGLGSRFIGGGRDYHLGLIASACALMAILIGQFGAAKIYIDKTLSTELAAFEYESRLEYAKQAESLRSEEDYRGFIAASRSTLSKSVAESSISPKEVLDFQMTELPKLKTFAAGQPSRESFIEQERNSFLEKLTLKDIFNASISPYLFLWVFVGVGAAWRLASDHGTSVE